MKSGEGMKYTEEDNLFQVKLTYNIICVEVQMPDLLLAISLQEMLVCLTVHSTSLHSVAYVVSSLHRHLVKEQLTHSEPKYLSSPWQMKSNA